MGGGVIRNSNRRTLAKLLGLLLAVATLTLSSLDADGAGAAARAPMCRPGGKLLRLSGSLGPAAENTYKLVPFRVGRGTTRVELSYAWDDRSGNDALTVLDLGLWDEDGAFKYGGFRGWSGNRHGNFENPEHEPVLVQRDRATRNYNPGKVRPGVWRVELGVGAIGPEGATWKIRLRCRRVPVGPAPQPDRVDPAHVADPDPGWYHGDFHMHAFHSNPNAPSQREWVEYVRAAELDFLPITEYVVNRHWNEWGATARANPDLLFWPGREIITYYGHAIVVGETPGVIDYRHGFKNVALGDIQRESVARGALFGIAHPTIWPPPLDDQCRGCFFELEDAVDWELVDTMEVLTGPVVVGGGFPNPFVATAIEYWEDRLLAGYKITAVSGSDDKLGPELGSSATAVYTEELSRPALIEAVRAGHAYVKTEGAKDSPQLELEAVTEDGAEGSFGDTLHADRATVEVTISGGDGQTLNVHKDGEPFGTVPIVGDEFSYSFEAVRDNAGGSLGTFYRIETFNGSYLTTIANPIFLQAPSRRNADSNGPRAAGAWRWDCAAHDSTSRADAAGASSSPRPRTPRSGPGAKRSRTSRCAPSASPT